MGLLLGLILLVIALAVGLSVLGFAIHLLYSLVIGLIIGTLAKIVLPGPTRLGWLATAIAGIIGSMAGSVIAYRVLHIYSFIGRNAVAVLCAAGVVYLLNQRRLPR